MAEQSLTERLIRAVRKLAQEKPENVYESGPMRCSYRRGECSDGTIGCLIGQAFVSIGEPLPLLDEPICFVLPYESQSRAPASWSQWVQNYQDKHHSWGTAVAAADAQCGPLYSEPPERERE